MEILTGILLLIVIAGALWFLKYQRQVKDICRQLAFLIKTDSNMLISTDLQTGGLKQLADTLNQLLDMRRSERRAHQEKERMIAEIYTSLSHDIRTPLTSLDGYFQLLEEGGSEEEQAYYIRIIQERIESLKEMLEEMFLFTKLKNDGYEMALSECCANKFVKDTVFSYYDEWKKNGIIPQIDICDEQMYFMGNEQGFRRILQNIIKNGLDHGENRIHIQLSAQEESFTLRIGNEVRHPEKIDISRVFDRFYKADEARSKTSSGLGLSIAKELAEKMGGELTAGIQGKEFYVQGVFRRIPS